MEQLKAKMADLGVDKAFLQRSVNEGFSGGEKKRFEILQMAMLDPVFAVLDETDSGLDIDALRIVSEGVNDIRTEDMGILLVTHYSRILNYITPDRIAGDVRRPHRGRGRPRDGRGAGGHRLRRHPRQRLTLDILEPA